jgi:DNA-binding transcriptional LysR family regulator
MKLQQLRFLAQVVASDFNVTAAAAVLHTSQSGVSHQIRLLEEELGATIFLRQDKRLAGLTDIGGEIAIQARELLLRAAQLRQVAADFEATDPSELVVATTHVHARYSLLPAVTEFSRRFPSTALRLIQTFPEEIFELLGDGAADLGLTTDLPPDPERFEFIPAYTMGRCLIAPIGHALLRHAKPRLADIARYPLVVYDSRMGSGQIVNDAFAHVGITPNVVLSAVDVDVIKAYVAAGVGVAIVPTLAYRAGTDKGLGSRPLGHVFKGSMTSIVVRRGKYLRRSTKTFIEILTSQRTEGTSPA